MGSGGTNVRTVCTLCQKGCGVIVHVRDGKAYQVEGDPENPLNEGRLCMKGVATLEVAYHPNRLMYPMARAAGRGEGRWTRISWDEAYRRTAQAFNKIKTDIGAESVAFVRGASKAHLDVAIGRLATAFGSPNLAAMGQSCHVPRQMACVLTCGDYATADIEYPPACILVWGYNPKETFPCESEAIIQASYKGARIIVVDPMKTNLAALAKPWVKLRPGTDLALALGMMHVMMEENLYDREFVEKWTVGFDELKAHVASYTPDKVEAITWVPEALLKEMTRAYARLKPACIAWGNAIDNGFASFQAARAIFMLNVISGNLGVPGGQTFWGPLPVAGREGRPSPEMAPQVGFEAKIIPVYKSAIPDRLVSAMLYDDPYPVRGAFVQGGNPVMTYNRSDLVHKAFKSLDFLAVADMFLTPTAALADIVFPSATYLEFDAVVVPPQNIPIVLAQRKAVDIGECRCGIRILSDLAKHLGVAEQFGWESEVQAFNEILKPSGLTLEQFLKVGAIKTTKVFREYESKGFGTPSGKVELYSKRLKKWGYDPLPVYYEPPQTPYSEPALSGTYPFILSSWKPDVYRHAWGHEIPSLRAAHPDPIVTIHPEAAGPLGIDDGDWVYIETKRGKIRQKARLSPDLDPRVVMAEFGWWYPEREASDESAWRESNINILTDETLFNRAGGASNEMGSPMLRGMFCSVHK